MFLLLTTLATAQQTSASKSAEFGIPEPKLPVIDYKACPGEGRIVPHEKIIRNDRMYSSWQNNRVSVRTLKAGEEVTVLAGVNVVREPDRALVKQPEQLDKDLSLKPGDVVLRYGDHADGYSDFWARGVWYTEYFEQIVDKGGRCGFAAGFGQGGCTVVIIKNGAKEWWVQVKTSSGSTGWVLAAKLVGDKSGKRGNFGDLCMLD